MAQLVPGASRASRVRIVVTACALASLFVVGCSTSSSVLATAESGERGERTLTGGAADFCAAMEEFAAEGDIQASEDPEAVREAADRLRAMAESAPAELVEHLEAFADLMDAIADLEEQAGDGSGLDGMGEAFEMMGEVMALMFDPAILEAGEALSEYMVTECGFDPDDADVFGSMDDLGEFDDFGGLDDFGEFDDFDDFGEFDDFGDADDPSRITLEDIEAVEEANEGAAWVAVGYSTSVVNGSDVQLVAGGFSDDTFAAADALAACEALRGAFAERNPSLSIEILNDTEVVARGDATTACSGG